MARATLPNEETTGVVVADLTGDGRTDIVVGSRLFVAQPDGTLSERVSALPERGHGGSAADFDGDGDLDLFFSGSSPRLLRNDAGSFTDITEAAPFGELERPNTASWADVDGDGNLDFFVPVATEDSSQVGGAVPEDFVEALILGVMAPSLPNRLFLGEGDGTFVDVSDRLPRAAQEAYAMIGGWYDVNDDGNPDLILVNDFGPQVVPNQLLLNRGRGQQFDDVSAESGLGVVGYGMGLGVGDLNGDLLPDFLSTDWGLVNLRESWTDGAWISSETARGMVVGDPRQAAWATELIDIDNDRDLDAVMAFGQVPGHTTAEAERIQEGLGLSNPEGQPDALFIQDASGQFVEEAVEWGLDGRSDGQSVVTADLNQDGWLDVVKEDGIFLSRCGEQSWLRVRLWGSRNNPNGIGARVEVDLSDRTLVRWIESGSVGFQSSRPAEAHFGLGDDTPEAVRVIWPDGETTMTRGIEADRIVMLVRSDALLEPSTLPVGLLH